jgi:hypothetical protein
MGSFGLSKLAEIPQHGKLQFVLFGKTLVYRGAMAENVLKMKFSSSKLPCMSYR